MYLRLIFFFLLKILLKFFNVKINNIIIVTFVEQKNIQVFRIDEKNKTT